MAKIKKINWKSKKTWKNALIIGLACITIVGAVVGLSSLFRKSEETTKEINPTYAVGKLSTTGAFLEDSGSIYSKDAFECQGLDIDIDFEHNISYQVYFYNDNGSFVTKTSVLDSDYNLDVSNVTKARIVITPKDDQKISWYEINGYANQLTIKVNKDQTAITHPVQIDGKKSVDLVNRGVGYFGVTTSNGFVASEDLGLWNFFGTIDVSSANKIVLKVDTSSLTTKINVGDVEYDNINIADWSYGKTSDHGDCFYGISTIDYETLLVTGNVAFISIDVKEYTTIYLATDNFTAKLLECWFI